MSTEKLIDSADTAEADAATGRKVIEDIRAAVSHLPRSKAAVPSEPFMIFQDEGQWSPEEIERWGALQDEFRRIGQPQESKMNNRFSDFEAYRAAHGRFSLCGCLVKGGTAIIRHHDDTSVFTINLDSLEVQEHRAEGFFSTTIMIPILVDDMAFMANPEAAEAAVAMQIRAEEKCGFFRPQ